MPATRPRSALALVAVSAVAVAGYSRLFADAGWMIPAALAVAGAHLVGAATGAWRWTRAVAAHALALAVLLAGTVGGSTVAGLPTVATVERLGTAISDAGGAFRSAIVPAPTTPELILWVVAGTWVCAAISQRLARRRPASLGAAVPLVVIQVLVAVLGTGRLRSLTSFAFAASVALYAAWSRAESLPRGQARVVPGPSGPSRGRRARDRWASRPVVAGAAAAVAVGTSALALGPLVPGAASVPLVDVHALGVALDVSRVELNPLVDIRRRLVATDEVELFTVRTDAPAYWRLTSLEHFDGKLWSPARPALHQQEAVRTRPAVESTSPPLTQEFRIAALDSPWLPAAHRIVDARVPGARLDPRSDALVTRRGSRHVSAYTVESRPPTDPSASAEAAAASEVPDDGLASYLELPDDFPPAVRQLARRFIESGTTPYERAFALKDNLRLRYAYDTSVPAGHSSDALVRFLFETRSGYCEQFAGAYAAMARSVGLPARVAVGFTPGTYDPEADVWRVTTADVHAWPEVFLRGAGWVAVEPTPGRFQPGDPEQPDDRRGDRGAPLLGAVGGPAVSERLAPGAGTGVDAGPLARFGGGGDGGAGWPWWWMLGATAACTLAFPPGAKALRRRLRRSAWTDEPAVPAAWREALERLSEVGLRPATAETPFEFARRVATDRPATTGPMSGLATAISGYTYSPTTPTRSDGQAAWGEADQLSRALDEGQRAVSKVRRRLDPRPLLPPSLSWRRTPR